MPCHGAECEQHERRQRADGGDEAAPRCAAGLWSLGRVDDLNQGALAALVEPGKFANWIAPPLMGINRQPVDFEYVRFN